MGVNGQSIQKQVREAMARQVLLGRPSIGEHQPGRVHPTRYGFSAKDLLRRSTVTQQPQHTTLHRAQKPHPDIEYRRSDLVIGVEAAEHEALVRETHLPPRRRMFTSSP